MVSRWMLVDISGIETGADDSGELRFRYCEPRENPIFIFAYIFAT